jgi:hypothetical protein
VTDNNVTDNNDNVTDNNDNVTDNNDPRWKPEIKFIYCVLSGQFFFFFL